MDDTFLPVPFFVCAIQDERCQRRGAGRRRKIQRDIPDPAGSSLAEKLDQLVAHSDRQTGRLQELMLVRTDADLDAFCRRYGLDRGSLKTIY